MQSLATTTNVIWSDTGRVSQPVFSLVWHDVKLTQPHGDWRTFRACPLWLHFWSVQLNFLTGWVSALQRTVFFCFLSHFVWEEFLGYQYHRGTMGNPMSGTTGTSNRTSMPPLSLLFISLLLYVCVCVCVYRGICVEVMKITCGISFPSPGGFQGLSSGHQAPNYWATLLAPFFSPLALSSLWSVVMAVYAQFMLETLELFIVCGWHVCELHQHKAALFLEKVPLEKSHLNTLETVFWLIQN